jgi:dCTP deaminase
MKLSDRHIRKYLEDGKIKITPAPDLSVQLGTISIDLRLDNKFSVFNYTTHPYIDTRSNTEDYIKEIIIGEEESFILQPGAFAIASTMEWVELADDVVAELHGRSSIARLGIIVHGTASLFDPGWSGKVVLELHNVGPMPIKLYPAMRICALTFEQVSSSVDVPYKEKVNGKYVGQQGPVGSRIYMDKNGTSNKEPAKDHDKSDSQK